MQSANSFALALWNAHPAMGMHNPGAVLLPIEGF